MKIRTLTLILSLTIFSTNSYAFTSCELIGHLAKATFSFKQKNISEKKVEEAVLKHLEIYKEDFSHSEYRKMRLQAESMVETIYDLKVKKHISDFEFLSIEREWKTKCMQNKIRIF